MELLQIWNCYMRVCEMFPRYALLSSAKSAMISERMPAWSGSRVETRCTLRDYWEISITMWSRNASDPWKTNKKLTCNSPRDSWNYCIVFRHWNIQNVLISSMATYFWVPYKYIVLSNHPASDWTEKCRHQMVIIIECLKRFVMLVSAVWLCTERTAWKHATPRNSFSDRPIRTSTETNSNWGLTCPTELSRLWSWQMGAYMKREHDRRFIFGPIDAVCNGCATYRTSKQMKAASVLWLRPKLTSISDSAGATSEMFSWYLLSQAPASSSVVPSTATHNK